MPAAPAGSAVLAWHSPPAPKPYAPLGSMTAPARRWQLGSAHRDPGAKARYFQPTGSHCTRKALVPGRGCGRQGANVRWLLSRASCGIQPASSHSLAWVGRAGWPLQTERANVRSRAGDGGHRGRRREPELLPGQEPGEMEVREKEGCSLITVPGLSPA